MVEQGNTVNGFYSYIIPEGVPVNGTFYVGWKQLSESFLNVGYDVNTPNAGKQFYWLNGEWSQSEVPGSIMIRPVIGLPLTITSIKDIQYNNNRKSLKIWPNPAKDYINFDPGELQISGLSYISLSDLNGHEIMRVPFKERIDISSLHDGMYFIVISINNIPVSYSRLIKTR